MYNKIITLLFLLSSFMQTINAIKCYQCNGEDNLCTVGLLGDKIECPKSTKYCYKSWTVETSPLTKRKCADDREYGQVCKDVLFGQRSMLACYCSDEDFCNSAFSHKPISWTILTLSFLSLARILH